MTTTTEPPGIRSGATADDPTDIPSQGWRQILRRTKDEIKDDRVTLMAAGMAFYAMLALFPALAAAITIWGLVADPAQVQRTIADAAQALPSGAADLLSEQMTRIADSSGTALGWTLVATLAGALWSASSGTKGMMEAVNAAYDEDETRGFVRVRGMALALTLGGIFFGLLLVGLVAVVPGVLSLVGLGSLAENLVRWGRWPVLAVVLALGLAVIYRYAPDRDQPRWRWMTPGSIAAVVLWLVASAGFAWYVNSFGSYSETYGSIAGVIVLMLWFFISALAVLVGAELNAEVERQPRGVGATDDTRQIDLREPDAAERPVRSGPS
ncbi:MAG: YihY/virulence factor BrkB family protein [Actinomycetota bacterium]